MRYYYAIKLPKNIYIFQKPYIKKHISKNIYQKIYIKNIFEFKI